MVKSTEIDWNAVKKELEQQDWEPTECGGSERMVYIGSVFSLFPSGKYYMPWACSNLDVCPGCNGTGVVIPVKARVWKRWNKRLERHRVLCSKRGRNYAMKRWDLCEKYLYKKTHSAICPQCGGCGSREAYLDEQYREMLESEAESHGLFVTSGDGDACDIFVGEYAEDDEHE